MEPCVPPLHQTAKSSRGAGLLDAVGWPYIEVRERAISCPDLLHPPQ